MQTFPILRAVFTICFVVAGLICASSVSAESGTVQRIEWQKVPIEVPLVVGAERRIEFPAPVKVGLPGTIEPLLRAQSVNGVVYLLANAAFESSRVMVREIDSGRVYLFDVTAAEAGTPGGPLQIFVNVDPGSTDATATKGGRSKTRRHNTIELTRFAARQLYGPSRLADALPGVVRVPLESQPVDLIHGAAIEAVPLAGWRANGLYITAVKLSNLTLQPQTLDPRELRGGWLTATFQHHRLLAKGDAADTTAVYLISKQPFDVSR